MQVVEPGHRYNLDTYDNKDLVQLLSLEFFKRVGDKYPGNEGEPHSGTNCQEVIRVLIDRISYLNGQRKHINNLAILFKLRQCLWLLEDRAASEHKIDQFDFIPDDIEIYEACKECGHLVCNC